MSTSKRTFRLFRNASLLLGLINIYQPVSRERLLLELGSEKDEDLADALRFLASRGLIRDLPNDQYRTTWAGQQSLSRQVLGLSRDLQRMWYLADRSDGRM